MKNFTLFSLLALFFSAPLYALNIKEELLNQAETTVSTVVDNITTNAYTLHTDAKKCYDKKPAEIKSCLQGVLQQVQQEQTKDWKALGNMLVAHLAISYASSAVGTLTPNNRRDNTFSQTVNILQLPICCGFPIAFLDLISLYWLENSIEKDLKQK